MVLKLNAQVEWNIIIDTNTNRPRTIVVKFYNIRIKQKYSKVPIYCRDKTYL